VATPSAALPWEFGASAFVFLPPDDDTFVSPIVDADRGALHLEVRYNYEDLETGSAFVGRTIPFKSEDVSGSVVPIVGLVLGNTAGIAPGVNIDLSWGRFAFTDETEFVITLPDFDESFLYSWIEATLEPVRGLRVGIAAQRTKLPEVGLALRRGPMLSLSTERGWLGAYWFNPDREDEETIVFAAGIAFYGR
jgi:hypothetical protein